MFYNSLLVALLSIASLVCAEDEILRPCNLECEEEATACVSKYFSKHSNCCPDVPGFFPPFFLIPYIKSEGTTNNITEARYNTIVSIKDGKVWIEDFFIDKSTDELYLVINFDNIWGTGEAHYTYYAPDKPDRTIVTVSYERYPNMKVTIKIPCSHNLDFTKKEVRCYVSEIPADFELGAGFDIAAKKDPDFHCLLKSIKSNLTPQVQEMFLERAVFLANEYINSVLCNID